MIRVENLHKYFGDLKVLKGINEHIQEGEVVAVIGPSGSGKSTFLRCLNLLETPTEGKIFVDDEQINAPKVDVNRIRQKMGMVFQQFNLFPHLTVMENLALAPVLLKKMTKEQAGKGQRVVETGWSGRKGRILSESAFRRSEAANCDCKSTGNESGNHAV